MNPRSAREFVAMAHLLGPSPLFAQFVWDLPRGTTAEAAWGVCDLGPEMLWIAGASCVDDADRRRVLRCLVACAEAVVCHWTERYPTDDRPVTALRAADLWLRGVFPLGLVIRSRNDARASVLAAEMTGPHHVAVACWSIASMTEGFGDAGMGVARDRRRGWPSWRWAVADTARTIVSAATAATGSTAPGVAHKQAKAAMAKIVRHGFPWPIIDGAVSRALEHSEVPGERL